MTRYNPDNTAVVVVDMQNDFCDEDGALYAPASEEVIDPIDTVVQRAADAGAPVVFTRDVHPQEQFDDAHYYDEFDQWGEHVVEDTWGVEIVDELRAEERADLVVDKHTYNAFHETELDGWLEAHGIDNLLLCGTLANVCLLHTASGAGLRDYAPLIVEDAIGYIEESHKEYALDHAEWLFGERITTGEVAFY